MSRCTKKEKSKKVRVFEGVMYAPNETGDASWQCEDADDATKASRDEDWFAWAEKKKVRITIERLP